MVSTSLREYLQNYAETIEYLYFSYCTFATALQYSLNVLGLKLCLSLSCLATARIIVNLVNVIYFAL
jgi:hypothetical protein